MNSRIALTAILLSTALAPLAPADHRIVGPEVVGGERLPRTQEGQIALAFIGMLNDGSAEAVREFETAHRAPAMLAAVPVEERAKRVAQMNSEFGQIAVDEVLDTGRGMLLLTAHDRMGRTLVMDFEFDSAGKLRGVALETGDNSIKPRALTQEAAKSVINSAIAALEREYVFPDLAKKMGEHVRRRFSEGAYSGIRTENALARALTEDFRAVSRDLHLRVNVRPQSQERAPAPGAAAGPPTQTGFKKVEILDGNIGYVRLDGFASGDEAKRAATAAMNFVSGCDAVIFDMRYNGGGDPDQVRFITSYIFGEPVHLNSMIDRNGNTVEEFWTLKEVPGQRLRDGIPLFVLTSNRTFSGAEEFTYNLKALERATVIGERTGGGAHPVRGVRINDRFVVGVPFMRANNPITKTNWEGKGVEPDVEVGSEEALDHAIDQARAAIAKAGR